MITVAISMVFDASFPVKTSLKRWPWQKSLYFSLSTCYLPALSSPPPLSAPISYMSFFTIFFHLTTGFLSSYEPQFHSYSFFLPFPYTTLHFICTRSQATPFINAFIAQTLPSFMLLSDNSSPQYALLIIVPYSISKSLIHMSVFAGECCSLILSLPPWIHSFLS